MYSLELFTLRFVYREGYHLSSFSLDYTLLFKMLPFTTLKEVYFLSFSLYYRPSFETIFFWRPSVLQYYTYADSTNVQWCPNLTIVTSWLMIFQFRHTNIYRNNNRFWATFTKFALSELQSRLIGKSLVNKNPWWWFIVKSSSVYSFRLNPRLNW